MEQSIGQAHQFARRYVFTLCMMNADMNQRVRQIKSLLGGIGLMLIAAGPAQGRDHVGNVCEMYLTADDAKDLYEHTTTKRQRELHDAVIRNDEQEVRALLMRRINVNFPDPAVWLIERGVLTGNPQIVEGLLKAGANPNVKDCRGDPAMASLSSIFPEPTDDQAVVEIANQLVASGAKLKGGWLSILLNWAAQHGHLNLINWLLDHGVDVNGEWDGFTALSSAADPIRGPVDAARLAAAKLLIDRGAKVNKAPSNMPPPLLEAVEGGNPQLVRLLLEHHADPNQGLISGTPLSSALGSERLAAEGSPDRKRWTSIVKTTSPLS